MKSCAHCSDTLVDIRRDQIDGRDKCSSLKKKCDSAQSMEELQVTSTAGMGIERSIGLLANVIPLCNSA